MDERILSFDILDKLADKYKTENGVDPFNLSYWNPSSSFNTKMMSYLKLKYQVNLIDYNYTYLLPIKEKILKKFGFDFNIKDCMFTDNNTISIMMIVNWLYNNKIKKINIVCPTYFSSINICNNFDIHCNFIETDILDSYKIDINLKTKGEVFWFTNPIYSTGHYLDAHHIDIIQKIIDNNLVILDESNANINMELSFKFGNHRNFIGIYSPHKSLCINGLKFSFFTFNHSEEPFFDKSVDYLCGGLSASSVNAIYHTLSDNFIEYSHHFYCKMEESKQFILEICKKNKNIYFDSYSNHYLRSIYFTNIDANKGDDIDFLWNIINQTGSIFFPGTLNYFPLKSGFSFRLNLARDCSQFRASFIRLINVLSIL
jgi:hypothetical protein